MGALHEGHISLVRLARAQADAVVVSIFVNPAQFGPNEDFSRYPRSEEADIALLREAGADAVYLPDAAEMYPPGAITRVTVPGISAELCGAVRPGHFDGVATIVTKLFMQCAPDVAVFGEKDYQQLHVIRRFTADLDIPVRIVGAPIIREADGLALSSRNRYLAGSARAMAPALYTILTVAADKIRRGQEVEAILAEAGRAILAAGFAKVDYVELRDTEHLRPLATLSAPARLLAAAHLGTTRLIDNLEVLP